MSNLLIWYLTETVYIAYVLINSKDASKRNTKPNCKFKFFIKLIAFSSQFYDKHFNSLLYSQAST